MKQILIDVLLVIIIMCFVGLYFDDYEISQVVFERSLESFETDVEQNKNYEVSSVYYPSYDNAVSLVFMSISEICISIMEFFVMIFSHFVSMILMNVLY